MDEHLNLCKKKMRKTLIFLRIEQFVLDIMPLFIYNNPNAV